MTWGSEFFSGGTSGNVADLFLPVAVAELKGDGVISAAAVLCFILFNSRWDRCDSGVNRALYERSVFSADQPQSATSAQFTVSNC